MKKKKRILIAAFLVLLITGLFLIYNTVLPKESVARNKSVRMAECNWKPTIANSVNKSVIIANVDAKQLKSNINGIYMEESMALMFPLETIKETFDCAVNKYNYSILIEKGNVILKLFTETDAYEFNGERKRKENSLLLKGNQYFVSADILCASLSYQYNFDLKTNQATISSLDNEVRTIPYAYNYENVGRISKVRNQGNLGTCWAFASLTALETTLMPEELLEFSVDHMTLNN